MIKWTNANVFFLIFCFCLIIYDFPPAASTFMTVQHLTLIPSGWNTVNRKCENLKTETKFKSTQKTDTRSLNSFTAGRKFLLTYTLF